MSQFDEANVQSLAAACRDNAEVIAQCFNRCFGSDFRLAVGESRTWNAEAIGQELDRPGLVVAFRAGDHAIACLIPETVPLPDWYARPDESQESRLQTLAKEWSQAMLPAEFESDAFLAVPVSDLRTKLTALQPFDWSAALDLELLPPDGDEPPPPAAKLCLIGPVAHMPLLAEPAASETEPSLPPEPPRQPQPASPPHAQPAATAQAVSLAATVRTKRLLKLPVTIVVRLADKKIEIGQLLALSPGALITFSKSCEDLLDLYVNNRRYCRGEAVKIGEKFGLKIIDVGTEAIYERRVMNG